MAVTRSAKSRYIISTLISFVLGGVGLNTTTKITSLLVTLAWVEPPVKRLKKLHFSRVFFECKAIFPPMKSSLSNFNYFMLAKMEFVVRWNEHNNPTKSSEPSKHHQSNINHYFTWAAISNARKNAKTLKNLEAYIAL